MERWRRRNALVTGGSAGIGLAIVKELLDHGMNVVTCARSPESLKAKYKNGKAKLVVVKCDVAKEDQIASMFMQIEKEFGHVDVLVNNAGVGQLGDFFSRKTQDWRQMLDINILGLSICTREALRLMEKDGIDDGTIININSTTGHFVTQHDSIHFYSATKHMVTAITQALNMELKAKKSKIRITSLSPGSTDTPALTRVMDHPDFSGRQFEILRPDDVADSVIYIVGAPAHVMIKELTIVPVEDSAMP